MPATPVLRQELRFTHLPGGVRLAWARSGRGPPLLRAGHWMSHVEFDAVSALFRPWLEQLGRHATIVRYDERGTGLSGSDGRLPDLETAVEEIAAVADAAGLERLSLLGMSGGAAPAIAFAARHPARIERLVLVGAYSHGLLHSALEPAQRAYLDAQAALIESGWGRPHAPVQQFLTASLIPDATPAQVAALNEQQRRSCDGPRAAAFFRSRLLLDVRGEIGAVRCPTLVLHCDRDAAVSIDCGREVAASIPGARFEALRSANHLPLAGEPAFDRMCEAVGEFLSAGPPAAAPDGRAFTARERALLALVARGRDNLQIAAELGLAEKTVRNALSQLYARLQVDGRSHAVVRARELGFG
jgi:pimeloyl-ACP methyl ester carboxylesterase/DNA-binding CsgD family transcriptional regulator